MTTVQELHALSPHRRREHAARAAHAYAAAYTQAAAAAQRLLNKTIDRLDQAGTITAADGTEWRRHPSGAWHNGATTANTTRDLVTILGSTK